MKAWEVLPETDYPLLLTILRSLQRKDAMIFITVDAHHVDGKILQTAAFRPGKISFKKNEQLHCVFRDFTIRPDSWAADDIPGAPSTKTVFFSGYSGEWLAVPLHEVDRVLNLSKTHEDHWVIGPSLD